MLVQTANQLGQNGNVLAHFFAGTESCERTVKVKPEIHSKKRATIALV